VDCVEKPCGIDGRPLPGRAGGKRPPTIGRMALSSTSVGGGRPGASQVVTPNEPPPNDSPTILPTEVHSPDPISEPARLTPDPVVEPLPPEPIEALLARTTIACDDCLAVECQKGLLPDALVVHFFVTAVANPVTRLVICLYFPESLSKALLCYSRAFYSYPQPGL
jgi:hypothetical protein